MSRIRKELGNDIRSLLLAPNSHQFLRIPSHTFLIVGVQFHTLFKVAYRLLVTFASLLHQSHVKE